MLGPRDKLVGRLHIEGDLHLGGTVDGEVTATGDVEIAHAASVKASVAGGDVSIRGHVSGPVTARKRLMVAGSGSLIGDIRVARLVIQEGATFSGNVSMGPHLEAAPQPLELVQAVEPPIPVAEPAAAPEADGHAKPSAEKGKAKPKRR